MEGPATDETLQGLIGTCKQADGLKGGRCTDRTHRQMQVHSMGRRDDRKRLAGDGRRVREMSRLTALPAGRGGGEQVQEKGAMTLEDTDEGAVGYRGERKDPENW